MTQHASRRRRRLFTVIALFIPILFFAVVEGGLRVLGFGEDYPLFVPFAAAPGYLQPNPDVVNRYFADPEQAPAVSIDTQFFLAEKAANGLRLFVQGGSTAAGFPYGNNASPAGLLRKRLQLSFPNQQVEVISTAMAAVNSYTLLDFADEIIAQQPDAVLI
ncbi:MAG: hypothetical protein HKN49_05540, partial [Gammaproteobacteria bacterium]|nr:hypothetical protein [Gammaproteobacteria bacterium]